MGDFTGKMGLPTFFTTFEAVLALSTFPRSPGPKVQNRGHVGVGHTNFFHETRGGVRGTSWPQLQEAKLSRI